MGCISSKTKSEEDGDLSEQQGLMNSEGVQEGEGEYTISPLTDGDMPVLSRDDALVNDSIVTTGRNYPSSTSPTDLENSVKDVARSPDRDQTGQHAPGGPLKPEEVLKSGRGKELLRDLREAYSWKNRYRHASHEFLSKMDRLFMECQLHLTAVSCQEENIIDGRREADALVQEMLLLRNHWGSQLLPSHVCNAFVRERIPLTLGTERRQFRVDCAQFFDPVPFYPNSDNPGELMKLFRFSVYDVDKGEVVLRYYLERSNVIQLYHVLCFTCENYRGQVHPYGTEVPCYWEVRQHMLEDVKSRLLSALSRGAHPPPAAHASTIFPAERGAGPVVIQISEQPGSTAT